MNNNSNEFKNVLSKATHYVENYVAYSPTQIARGDHLKNDPALGERAWSIPKTTGEFLYNLIRKTGSVNGLELGTSIGYSTLWIAAGLDENSEDFLLTTVERSTEKSQIAKDILSSTFPTISFHNEIITNYFATLAPDTTFDFIFMDADRGNYKEYWNYMKTFLHEKSIVVIDNALRDQKSVVEFQDFLSSDHNLSTYLHTMDNGLFIVTKSDGEYSDISSLI
jgi:predicted O-methyltransferase YrrM